MVVIIGISGFKGSGKDTVADHLVKHHGFTKVSFADKLKDACATIFEWDRDMLEGSTQESREWREEVDEWWAERLGVDDFSPRLALQWMGTEAGRKVFGQNIWTAAMEKFILENPGNYVIPDVRFRNEVKLVHNMRGKMIRVKRGPEPDWYDDAKDWNKIEKSGSMPNAMEPGIIGKIHASEREWIGEKMDIHLENDTTTERLCEIAEAILGLVEVTGVPEDLTSQSVNHPDSNHQETTQSGS